MFGPGVPGGARQATDEELGVMRVQSLASRRSFEAILADVLREHGERLCDCARKLLAEGRCRGAFGPDALEARLLRFWRGDRVLRIEYDAAGSASSRFSSVSRIPRHDSPDTEQILVHYLAAGLANVLSNR